ASGSAGVTFTYLPAAHAASSGTATLTLQDPLLSGFPDQGKSTVTVTLSGTGVAPIVDADKASIDFGDVRLLTDGVATVTLTNSGDTGTSLQTATAITTSPAQAFFSVTSPSRFPVPFAGSDATLDVTVHCTGAALGDATGTLTITF